MTFYQRKYLRTGVFADFVGKLIKGTLQKKDEGYIISL